LPDGVLLQRFVADREQQRSPRWSSRTAVRARRLPRVLGDSHAAQDAFQATFLVLARKAGGLDRQSPLTGWLYKVAYHLSLRLRAVAARRAPGKERRQRPVVAGCERILAGYRTAGTVPGTQRNCSACRRSIACRWYCATSTAGPCRGGRGDRLCRGSIAKRIGEGLERLRERLLDRGLML
jgi:hypothetical protein